MGDFHSQIVAQEGWSSFGFWLLIAGLLGEGFVVAAPRLFRIPHTLEIALGLSLTIVVALGCGFEHVAENKIADLESQESGQAGKDIAAAKNSAAQAIQRAAELGLKVDKLPDFVKAKEGEINGQIADFQKFSNSARNQANAAMERLQDDTAALDKTRADAETAATKAEAAQKAMEEANAPRWIPPDKQHDFVAKMKSFAGMRVNIVTPPSTTADAGPLAGELQELLTKADWKVGSAAPIAGWAKYVLVCTGKNPTPHVAEVSKELVLALRRADIPSFLDPDLGPSIPITGAAAQVDNPDLSILVGAKQ